jgi:hypothetical protein
MKIKTYAPVGMTILFLFLLLMLSFVMFSGQNAAKLNPSNIVVEKR